MQPSEHQWLIGQWVVAEYGDPADRLEGEILSLKADADGGVLFIVRDSIGTEHLIRSEEVIAI